VSNESRKPSVKRQLIDFYLERALLAKAAGDPYRGAFLTELARDLQQRGSGPLPRWAKHQAEELGLEGPP
jgi:hypothetical protein